MDMSTGDCREHARLCELACKKCKAFVCPECVEKHTDVCAGATFCNVLKYAEVVTMPKFSAMIESAKLNESAANLEKKSIIKELQEIVPSLVETINTHRANVEILEKISKELVLFLKQKPEEASQGKIIEALQSEKKKLENYLKDKKVKETLSLALKWEDKVKLVQKHEDPKALLDKAHASMLTIKSPTLFDDLSKSMTLASAKCTYLRLLSCTGGWKIDTKFKTSKMSISEDCLTYGTSVSNGYPAIIGDLPFEIGYYGYEVTVIQLDCSNEGFGIIERDAYLKIYEGDKTTPTAYSQMMGILWSSNVKSMTTIECSGIKLGSKYMVKVNMVDLVLTIKGPGVNLKGELKPGVVYAPCFSCGCTSNKLIIRPLDNFEEGE